MIKQVLTSSLISLSVGFLCQVVIIWLSSSFLTEYFKSNLLTILIALLAINATTMSLVLTKIRTLIDSANADKGGFFELTKSQMLLSVKEQVGLIILATTLLTVQASPKVLEIDNLSLLIDSMIIGVFVYALMILFDLAKGVLIIMDFKS
jgi:hypothetical protein